MIVPDIIPEDIRPGLMACLSGLSDPQVSDVLAVIANRLQLIEAGKADTIENITGYTRALAKKAAKGDLDIPPPVANERRESRLASDIERLRQAWEEGRQIVVDGHPATPDPWPFIRMPGGTSTVGSLLTDGADIEARAASP